MFFSKYFILKDKNFNGIKLPDLAILRENGDIEMAKEFGYEEYRRRNQGLHVKVLSLHVSLLIKF